ncbi:MAG: RNA polymerase factor sigma-54 [Bacteroidetes bacterium]|nr:MAG: RNA polymerase factor sigma-54 [Bacteroidota bacterium]
MLKQQLSQKLLQKLSPQQIQFIKLLQLSTQDFEQRVEQEMIENPALENGKDADDADFNQTETENTKEDDFEDIDSEVEKEDVFDDGDLFDLDDYMGGDSDGDGFHLYEESGSDDERKELPIASTSSFHEQLLEQIQASMHDEHEAVLAEQIIGSIEEDGYLRRPLGAIVNDLAFSMNVETTVEELEKVLHKIQSLEPAGIAARTLQECLLLQLKRKDKVLHPEVTLAIRIINDFFEDFTKKHYEKMLRQLKVKDEDFREAVTLITKLNPKPGDSGTNIKTQYIVPDFIIVDTDSKLEIVLNSRNAPDLRVSRTYLDTLKSYDRNQSNNKQIKETVQFIKQKLDGAKWFIDSIKQRQNTLLLTMNAILKYQYDYFLTGDETKLKPMILKDIADEVGLDVSTVSRVANSKYVQTDFGIISLKFFFSEGITTDDGEEVSNREVKKILQDAIEGEDKNKPLPDERLMEILKEKGYNIARRTVAKYREQLNIPVARLRKQI